MNYSRLSDCDTDDSDISLVEYSRPPPASTSPGIQETSFIFSSVPNQRDLPAHKRSDYIRLTVSQYKERVPEYVPVPKPQLTRGYKLGTWMTNIYLAMKKNLCGRNFGWKRGVNRLLRSPEGVAYYELEEELVAGWSTDEDETAQRELAFVSIPVESDDGGSDKDDRKSVGHEQEEGRGSPVSKPESHEEHEVKDELGEATEEEESDDEDPQLFDPEDINDPDSSDEYIDRDSESSAHSSDLYSEIDEAAVASLPVKRRKDDKIPPWEKFVGNIYSWLDLGESPYEPLPKEPLPQTPWVTHTCIFENQLLRTDILFKIQKMNTTIQSVSNWMVHNAEERPGSCLRKIWTNLYSRSSKMLDIFSILAEDRKHEGVYKDGVYDTYIEREKREEMKRGYPMIQKLLEKMEATFLEEEFLAGADTYLGQAKLDARCDAARWRFPRMHKGNLPSTAFLWTGGILMRYHRRECKFLRETQSRIDDILDDSLTSDKIPVTKTMLSITDEMGDLESVIVNLGGKKVDGIAGIHVDTPPVSSSDESDDYEIIDEEELKEEEPSKPMPSTSKNIKPIISKTSRATKRSTNMYAKIISRHEKADPSLKYTESSNFLTKYYQNKFLRTSRRRGLLKPPIYRPAPPGKEDNKVYMLDSTRDLREIHGETHEHIAKHFYPNYSQEDSFDEYLVNGLVMPSYNKVAGAFHWIRKKFSKARIAVVDMASGSGTVLQYETLENPATDTPEGIGLKEFQRRRLAEQEALEYGEEIIEETQL